MLTCGPLSMVIVVLLGLVPGDEALDAPGGAIQAAGFSRCLA